MEFLLIHGSANIQMREKLINVVCVLIEFYATKSSINRNKAVKQKASNKICTALTFYDKPLPIALIEEWAFFNESIEECPFSPSFNASRMPGLSIA